jgi:hypothetical protein
MEAKAAGLADAILLGFGSGPFAMTTRTRAMNEPPLRARFEGKFQCEE